jgi:BirA family biotin operon repressor/biotin-[acetyl-CoA-carboxylase] ligase
MSLLLRWSAATTAPPLLPLLAAVAVCDVVGPEALVKWPNDVVLRRQATSLAPTRHPHLAKLAGILIESSLQERWLVLGIGLNVAVNVASLPSELHTTAATLDRPVEDVETILHELLRSLERWLARPTADVLARWRGRDALLGTVVEWSNGRGMAEGVSDDGELLVRTDDGIVVELDSGEVSVSEPRLTG